jgi:hypothetical protein
LAFASVAQPPFPAQEFFPAQACFSVAVDTSALFFLEPSVAQPPFPAQEFFPAQECFSGLAVESLCAPACGALFGAALARAIAPPSKPVNAAAISKGLFEVFIVSSPKFRIEPHAFQTIRRRRQAFVVV